MPFVNDMGLFVIQGELKKPRSKEKHLPKENRNKLS